MTEPRIEEASKPVTEASVENRKVRITAWTVIALVIVFLGGLGSGYLQWGRDETAKATREKEMTRLYEQVNPSEGYGLGVTYGDLGPQLVEAGVIDYDAFMQVMSASGDAVSNRQIDMLKNGSDEEIVITRENAHFLLNFFWAVGLASKNSILTDGMMVQYSEGQVERFASTGGWTLANKPVTDIYASLDLIPLTAEQQARVEEVAAAVYRPCCNNPTLFPDCNHGMAMLGLLEWMASNGATVDEMFAAAKYVNAFWFPQQNLEIAMYLQTSQNVDFEDAEPRQIVSTQFSSGSGAAMVHQQLQASGVLPQAPGGQGGSCAN
jgi:hypothetical protein